VRVPRYVEDKPAYYEVERLPDGSVEPVEPAPLADPALLDELRERLEGVARDGVGDPV
jgi:hypothetical protein